MVQLEQTFMRNHGIATLARVLRDKTRLCPVARLALRRHGEALTDADVERAKWDVVRHLRAILRDERYMPRDLVAAMCADPRALAVLLVRHLKGDTH